MTMRQLVALFLISSMVGCTVERQADGSTNMHVSKEVTQAGEQAATRTRELADEAANATRQGTMTAKIASTIRSAGAIHIEDLDVDTVGTTITLNGTADSEDSRVKAQQLAEIMAGPDYTVVNKLAVGKNK